MSMEICSVRAGRSCGNSIGSARINEGLPAENLVQPQDVLLMPEGVDLETLSARSRWIADLCKQNGYRLSPRLHVYLWGNTKGT